MTRAALRPICTGIAMLCLAMTTLAADAPAPEAPLRFQRLYAPTNRVADWPREPGVKYRPVDTAEFERLLQEARAADKGISRLAAARITRSEYRARLIGDDLLTGEAILHVEHPGTGSSLLELDPWRQAVTHVRWEAGDDGAPRDSSPAVLGAGPHGKAAVVVDRGGALRVEWSLQGRAAVGAGMAFELELPVSPLTSLELELPASSGLHASAGTLTPLVEHQVPGGDAANAGAARTWRLSLGGRSRVTLQIGPDAENASQRQPFVRQGSTYEIARRGAELAITLELEMDGPAVDRLEVDLDPHVSLVSAVVGQSVAPFTVSVDPESHSGRAVIDLPEPLDKSALRVQLAALAPVDVDRPWSLPRIRPRNVFWQQGQTTLLVDAALRLDRLTLSGCRQSLASQVAPPKAAELVELQCFEPDASAELLLSTRPDLPRLTSGATVTLGAGELTSRARHVLELAAGERFHLRARVLPQWTIDSVASDPPSALTDWELRLDELGGRTLHCRFTRPLSASHPVTLDVAARKLRSPLGEVLTLDELQVLEFEDVAGPTRLMRVLATGPYQVRLTGDERLARLDPARLPARQAALFDKQPDGLMFQVDAGASRLGIALDPRSPRFQADIEVEAAVFGAVLCESYVIRCVPEAGALERVAVRLSQARRVDLDWTLDDGTMTVDARRLSVTPPPDGDADEGETWEVLLPGGMTAPFELRARRCAPLDGPTGIGLASLPSATRQSGALSIHLRDGAAARIDNRDLVPLPVPAPNERHDSSLRGRFRFDPQRQASPLVEPALLVTPLPGDAAPPGLVAWECRIATRLDPSGALHHAAIMRVENLGAGQLTIGLPSAARVELVSLDNDLVARRYDEAHRLLVDVPADRPRATIGLRFSTPLAGGNWPRDVVMPDIRLDAPVLARDWTLWLPPGYGPLAPVESGGDDAIGWRQRLFGVFARGPGEAPFNPFSPADWAAWSGEPPQRAAAREAVHQLLEALGGDSSDSHPAASDPDWRGRLLMASDTLEQGGALLLIDRGGLAAAGVRPDSPIRPGAGGSPRERGIGMIERAGLAVLAREGVVLLTSAYRAARLGPLLERWHGPCIGWIDRGPLADALREAGRDVGSESFVRVTAWRAAVSDHVSPASPAAFDPVDTLGWSAWRPVVVDQAASLAVVPSNLLVVLGWAVFLLAFLACWRASDKARWPLCLVCGVFAGLALAAPLAWAPLASGGFLGSLAGLALALVRSRPSLPTPERRSSVTSFRAPAQPAALLVLATAVAVALGDPVGAQDPPRDRPPATGRVHRVIVPVDNPDQPETPLYYLAPEEFLTELQRRAALATRQPRGWLIERATYRAQMVWDAGHRRISAGELRAAFDVQVFGGARRIRIPLSSVGLDPRPQRAFLDGVPVPIVWEEDGQAWSIPAPGPGPCRLELTLRPPTTLSLAGGSVQWDIPETPRATLELMLPSDSPAINVTSALAGVVSVEGGQRILAELGPAAQLRFDWRDEPAAHADRPNFEVDELLWLRVQPGSVVLDSAFKLTVLNGAVRSLRLRIDPRLRILPLEVADPLLAETRVDPTDPSVVELVFARPRSDASVARARFLVVGANGLGRLPLPRLDVLDASVVRRSLGATVDPAIEIARIDRDAGVEEMAVPDFAERWGGQEEATPQLAWRLGGEASTWSLSTVPLTRATDASAALTLSLGPRQAELRFEAELQAAAGSVFQRRLSVPAELRIDRVQVHEQGAEVSSRWVRDSAESVTVRLGEPASNPQQWTVYGWLPASTASPLALPRIGIDGVKIGASAIQVLRQPEIVVTATDVSGLSPLDAAATVARPSLPGRWALGFAATDPEFAANLVLAPNEPRVDAKQVTVLRRQEQGDWTAELRIGLRIEDGLLDELRVRIPRDWKGPFQVEPAAQVHFVDLPGEPWKQLLVRPRDALSADATVTIQAPLAAAADSPVVAPDARLLGIGASERILVLPTQVGLRQITWDARGLRPCEMPAALAGARISTALFEAYRVDDEEFQATLRQTRPVTGSPIVHLADVQVVWQADRSCQGLAAFDIAAADEASCPLWMPEGCQPIEVFVEGWNVVPLAEGAGRWRVPLGPDQLPRRIEVMFAGRIKGDDSGTVHCDAPSIGDWQVERTLWDVRGPEALGVGAPLSSEALGPLRSEVFRLQALAAQLVDVAADERRLSTWTLDDTTLWFAIRADRIARSLAQCERLAQDGRNPEVVRVAEADMRAAELNVGQAARRMGMAPTWQAALREKSSPADRSASLVGGASLMSTPARCAFQGPLGTLSLRYPTAATSDAAPRLALAGLLLALAIAAAWGLRRLTADRLARWLPVVGVVAGLAWWWWLSPSALGLLLAVISAVAWGLRRRVPSHGPGGSSIVELEALPQ